MRKFLLLIAVFSFAALGSVDAQSCAKSKKSCAKSCAAKKAAMSKKSTSADAVDVDAVAAKFASENESIERRVCAKSGKVSYFETSVCAKSGNTSVSEVAWDADNAKFVNMSPSDNAPAKKSCSKSKASCAKGAKASAKGCCAKGTCQKACCADKKASNGAKAVKASM